MKLTPEEREMLHGRRGEAPRRAMDALVQLGEVYGAEDMVPIGYAHVRAEAGAMSAAVEVRVRGIVRGTARGGALVSPDPSRSWAISTSGPATSSTRAHRSAGRASPGRSWSSRTAWAPLARGDSSISLFVHGTNPLAIVQRALPDPSLVQGAILARVPIVCDLETDVLAVIRSGDAVDVDGTRGIIRVMAKDGADGAA